MFCRKDVTPALACTTEKRFIDSIALAPLVCTQQIANNAVRMDKRERLLPSLCTTVADDFVFINAFACILLNNFYTQISSAVDNRISRQQTATVLGSSARYYCMFRRRFTARLGQSN